MELKNAKATGRNFPSGKKAGLAQDLVRDKKSKAQKNKAIFLSIISFVLFAVILGFVVLDDEVMIKPGNSDPSAVSGSVSTETYMSELKIPNANSPITRIPDTITSVNETAEINNSFSKEPSGILTSSSESAPKILQELLTVKPSDEIISSKTKPHQQLTKTRSIAQSQTMRKIQVAKKPKIPIQKQLSFEEMENILNEMHASDVATVMEKFTLAYNGANLDSIAHTLHENVKTGNNLSKVLLMAEYEKLFSITDKREFSLSKVHWDRLDDKAIGKGRFEVSVMEKGRSQEKTINGHITFHLTKNHPNVSITEIYYSYDD